MKLWELYWNFRLRGYRVDEAKGIIYNTKRWKFVVNNEEYDTSKLTGDKRRLHLHMGEKGTDQKWVYPTRIQKVTIG